MGKRADERIQTDLQVGIKDYRDDMVYSGTVSDISLNGMYIRTNELHVSEPVFEVILPVNRELVKVPVKIVRLVMKGSSYQGVGVRLLTVPQKYQELISSLSSMELVGA